MQVLMTPEFMIFPRVAREVKRGLSVGRIKHGCWRVRDHQRGSEEDDL